MKALIRAGICTGLAILMLSCLAFGASEGDAGAGAPPSTPGAALAWSSVAPEAYRICSGDLLSIIVWGEERFSQDCLVNAAGTISYPLLGDVPAAGATCSELQARLQGGLRTYLKHPRVIVTVRQYGGLGMSVFVLGEVKAPGVYPLASGSGLMQVLAAAGGPTRLAGGEITIVKARTGEVLTAGLEQAEPGAAAAPEAVLEPGDAIMVNPKPDAGQDRRYAVLGEVPIPGMFEIPADREVRVLDAVQRSGLFGVNPGPGPGAGGAAAELSRTADLEHAFLTRDEVVVPLDLAALLQGDTSQNLVLQPGDVLTVPRRALITVHALGEVQQPGRKLLPPNSTVLDLLNEVGGTSATAKPSAAIILRPVNGQPTAVPVQLDRLIRRADPKENFTLQEGDVLCVPARGEPRPGIWRWLPLLPYLVGL